MNLNEKLDITEHKEQPLNKKWYNNNVLVFALCFSLWPLGLYGLFKNNFLSKEAKIRFIHFAAMVIATLSYIGVWFNPPILEYTTLVELRGINSKGGTFFCFLTLASTILTYFKYFKKINNSVDNILKIINVSLFFYPAYYIFNFINLMDYLNGPVYFVLVVYILNILISLNIIKLNNFISGNSETQQ